MKRGSRFLTSVLVALILVVGLSGIEAKAAESQNQQLATYYATLAQMGGNESITKEQAQALADTYAQLAAAEKGGTAVVPSSVALPQITNISASQEFYQKTCNAIINLPPQLREKLIKKNIREHDVKYVFFDYIQTSPKILEEISRKSGGVRLREDNILFMLSAKMKDMANQYGVFVMSATQVNGEWKEADIPDQNLLRGAKSIADRIDLGEIQLPAREKDIAALESVLSSGNFPNPNFKLSFYKNRRGKYKGIYLWATGDLGTCRLRPMFATTWDYELIPMEDLKILIEENKSAF